MTILMIIAEKSITIGRYMFTECNGFSFYRDSVLHTPDENLSINENIDILTNLTGQLQKTFPTMDVYATYGNHDYFPSNQYPPHNNEIYNRTLEHWRTWINDSTQETNFLKGVWSVFFKSFKETG